MKFITVGKQITFFHVESPTCYVPGKYPETMHYTPQRADGLDKNLHSLKWVDIHYGRKGLTRICSGFHS